MKNKIKLALLITWILFITMYVAYRVYEVTLSAKLSALIGVSVATITILCFLVITGIGERRRRP